MSRVFSQAGCTRKNGITYRAFAIPALPSLISPLQRILRGFHKKGKNGSCYCCVFILTQI